MKTKPGLIVALILAASAAFFALGASSSDNPAFEYKLVDPVFKSKQDVLNNEGKDGWELVAVAGGNVHSGDTMFYLKRRIR